MAPLHVCTFRVGTPLRRFGVGLSGIQGKPTAFVYSFLSFQPGAFVVLLACVVLSCVVLCCLVLCGLGWVGLGLGLGLAGLGWVGLRACLLACRPACLPACLLAYLLACFFGCFFCVCLFVCLLACLLVCVLILFVPVVKCSFTWEMSVEFFAEIGAATVSCPSGVGSVPLRLPRNPAETFAEP